MAVADVFLRPLGLAALASIVPLVILYFLRPEPARVDLPTMRFLFDEESDEERSSVFKALQRDWLLLLQLLVLILVALALASPYVAVAEERVIDERVIVVDGSASMAAESGGQTRFARAIDGAKDVVTGTTSIVVSGASPSVALRRGPGPAARRTLDSLAVSHAGGDLADAISRATAIAGEGASIVVISDFVDESEWQAALATARARGYRVDVRPVGGRVDNVGIVDVSYATGTVTATVENFGRQRVTRSVSLGSESSQVQLDPGDTTTVQLSIPAGGGELRLGQGDAFPVDDRVPIAAPSDTSIDLLLLTNDENRFLTTALSLIDDVSLTVRRPPVTVTRDYDVILFSNVEPSKVLPGNIQTATEVLRRGGGVAIQAQPNVGTVNYGDLLLIQPQGVANGSSVDVVDDSLTRGITFAPPERYVTGELRSGRTLVAAPDGSPIIATAASRGGSILYYGFMEDASGFKYNYKYPVFWQRAVFQLAGRAPLASLNRETGTQLDVAANRTVQAPDGARAGPTVVLDRVGYYTDGEQRYGAALLDRSESNVTAPSVATDGDGGLGGRETEERTVPFDLTPFVAGGALVVGLVELVMLRRRGDL